MSSKNEFTHRNTDLLALCKKRMKNYRFHHEDIDYDDTGAIVAIIMYFIAKEPSICQTKLECYLILLDKICVRERQEHLFIWRLNDKGRISNFNVSIQSMLGQKLILKQENSKYRFKLLDNYDVQNILKNTFVFFPNVIYWLNYIVDAYKTKNSKNMLSMIIWN